MTANVKANNLGAVPAEPPAARRQLFPIRAVLGVVALCCLTAAVYREDCLRVAALDGGALGLGLKAIRGVVIIHYYGIVWLLGLAGVVWLLFSLRARNERHRVLWFFWVWLVFYVAQCAFSDMGSQAASVRWGRLVVHQLPVLLPLFFLPAIGGATRVRNWFFVGGLIQIAAVLILRQLAGADFSNLSATQDVETDRLIIQSDTITSSALLLQTVLCAIHTILDRTCARALRLAAMAGLPFAVLLALLTGSRGPLVAFATAVMTLVAVLLFSAGRSRIRRALSVLLLVLAAAGVLFKADFVLSNPVFERLTGVWKDLRTGGTEDETTTIRLHHYQLIIDAPPTAFGRGVGSFGRAVGDPSDYPHNIVLEAYYETGVVGLALFCGMILYYLARMARALRRHATGERIFCLTLFVFYFGLNQFSGGFTASAMWAVALILMAWSTLTPNGRAPAAPAATRMG